MVHLDCNKPFKWNVPSHEAFVYYYSCFVPLVNEIVNSMSHFVSKYIFFPSLFMCVCFVWLCVTFWKSCGKKYFLFLQKFLKAMWLQRINVQFVYDLCCWLFFFCFSFVLHSEFVFKWTLGQGVRNVDSHNLQLPLILTQDY